jgi:hypothetical protein
LPVDRSTIDRRKTKPKTPPARSGFVGGGGGDFAQSYKPAVAAHDLPPTRDARQRPYTYVLGHPGERSNIPPAQQIDLAKSTQRGRLTPTQSNNLARHLATIPHPVERLRRIGEVQQAGVLPPQVFPVALATAHIIGRALAGTPFSRLAEKTNELQSIPRLDAPVNDQQRNALEDVVRKQGRTVPKNATISDYYQAIYGPKPEGWKGLATNLPRDFLLTPVYSMEGGYALGGAAVKAAKGDTRDLREIAAQQVDVLRHPGAFAQQHPFQAALAVVGGVKGAGRVGAIGRELEATPRSVPLIDPETGALLPEVGGEVPAIPRGTLSTRNLTTRSAQRLSDALVSRSPRLQKHVVSGILRDARAESRAVASAERRPELEAFHQARKNVTRAEAQRVFENESRGITPAQHAAFRGAEDPGLAPLTPAQKALHAAHVALDAGQIERAGRLGLLSEFSAQRRAYLPAIKVAAKEGDPTAQRFLAVDTDAQQLRSELDDVTHPHASILRNQFDALQTAREVALRTFAAKHAASDAPEPAYVPEEPVKRVESAFARPGSGAGISAAKKRYAPTGPYNARLFEAGTYKPVTDEAIMRNYALPSRVEQAYRFAAEVSNPERGIVKRAKPGSEIPAGYVLQRVKEHDNPLADEITVEHGAKPAADPLHSLMSTFDLSRINDAARIGKPPTVPKGPGEYRLWPTSVYHQLAEMRSLNPPAGRNYAGTAGKVLRNALLYSRPAYPITNAVSNIIQNALIAGAGPSSYLRAEGDLPVPPRVQDIGTAAVNFDAPGASSLRNAWEDRGSTLGGAARVAIHPAARYAQHIYKASVDLENWTRRAAYLAKAYPEAVKQAHPEYGAARRWFSSSFRPADDAIKQVLDDMATGKTPEARASAERAVRVVNQALGDFAAMGENRALGVVVPFWRWTNFVRILLTQTLPIHYPGRALLLYRIGSLGQVAQHQLGPLTPSLQGAIPLSPDDVLSTRSVNPFGTLGENVIPTQGETALNPQAALSNLSPFAQIAYTAATRRDPVTGYELRNQYGLPIHGTDYLRVLASQGVNLLPPARALFGGDPSAPDTSIPLPGLTQTGPHRSGPQQPGQSPIVGAFNLVSPLRYRRVDLKLMAQQGDKKLRTQLKTAFRAHATQDVQKIMRRLAEERGVDLGQATPERTQVILDAVAEWKESR